MKQLVTIAFAAALAALPVASFAQTTGTPNLRRDFEQIHTQMQQIHQAERAQILAALTPAHKALVANVIGELAISATPDYDAAAKRLDAALSAGERQGVLNAAATARAKSTAIMQSIAPEHMGGPGLQMRTMPAQTAGQILLRLAAPEMHKMGFGMMMHP